MKYKANTLNAVVTAKTVVVDFTLELVDFALD